jgi:hypothetical protein
MTHRQYYYTQTSRDRAGFRSLKTLGHFKLCIIFKAESIISDLALRGVGSNLRAGGRSIRIRFPGSKRTPQDPSNNRVSKYDRSMYTIGDTECLNILHKLRIHAKS